MNSNSKRWKPGGTLQSTQRADYKPFPEATLQVYQFCSQPRKKPTPPSYATPPPKISEDTWAKYRKYCYRTTNSIYGSSSFSQKGKSLVATVLEKDSKESVAPQAKDGQANLSAQDAKLSESARPLQAWYQDTVAPPTDGSQQMAGASPPSTTVAQTSSFSSSSPSGTSMNLNLSSGSSPSASTLTTTITAAASSANQCHSSTGPAAAGPTSGGIKEAWKSDYAKTKEDAPVAKEITKATDKLPQIGSGEGSVGLGQLQEPKSISYEEFLRDMCHSVRLERLLNQRFVSQTTASLKGSQSEYTTNYRESFHNLHKEKKPLKAVTVKLPKTDVKQRRHVPILSEYADKFGFLQRTYPPSVCHNIAPVKAARPQAAVQRPIPLPRALLCSEYMASYRQPSVTSRPKTC